MKSLLNFNLYCENLLSNQLLSSHLFCDFNSSCLSSWWFLILTFCSSFSPPCPLLLSSFPTTHSHPPPPICIILHQLGLFFHNTTLQKFRQDLTPSFRNAFLMRNKWINTTKAIRVCVSLNVVNVCLCECMCVSLQEPWWRPRPAWPIFIRKHIPSLHYWLRANWFVYSFMNLG